MQKVFRDRCREPPPGGWQPDQKCGLSGASKPAMVDTSVSNPVMYVCTGCNFSKSQTKTHGVRGGHILWDALQTEVARRGGSAVHLEPVACLSVCQDSCAVALTASRKYTYTFGWVEPTPAAALDLLDMAERYAESPTGHVERAERPRSARRLVSRVPPPEFDPDRDDDARHPRMAEQIVKPVRALSPAEVPPVGVTAAAPAPKS